MKSGGENTWEPPELEKWCAERIDIKKDALTLLKRLKKKKKKTIITIGRGFRYNVKLMLR